MVVIDARQSIQKPISSIIEHEFRGSLLGSSWDETNPNRSVSHVLFNIDRNLTIQSSSPSHPFLSKPILAPLLFPNESSDARDHCANERTFLSWLRLSVYMSVVSVAIVISFHLKSQPTSIERRFAFPLGLIFWILSLACLASGLANYINTMTKYSRKKALVQSGWKTQLVGPTTAKKLILLLTLLYRFLQLLQAPSSRHVFCSFRRMLHQVARSSTGLL